MKTAHSSKRIAVLREHVAILERNTEYSRWTPEGAVRSVTARPRFRFRRRDELGAVRRAVSGGAGAVAAPRRRVRAAARP